MAKKKLVGLIRLQIPAGKATPAPPIGPALGSKQVPIMEFCKQFNERTAQQQGEILPVVISVYSDKSFTFITKKPPAAQMIKKKAGLTSGSATPHSNKVATITWEQVMEIAKDKYEDMNASSIEAAASMIEGTCMQMGVIVKKEDQTAAPAA